MIIYLDESGDLGWKFTAPYRFGGSSRYLTIASLVVNPDKKYLPKRLIRKLYLKFNWPGHIEKKWAGMAPEERVWFAKYANTLCTKYPDNIRYIAITVKKENVQQHVRTDPNKLYNYMIGLSLLNEMAKHRVVTLVPDPRSIKIESRNSLHDYLQTQLWFDKQVSTLLTTRPCDSAANSNVQFADMLSGVIQGYFEDGHSESWSILRHNISYKTLFF